MLFITINANAALIDKGAWTTDSATGLDWLDLSITDGMTFSDALSINTGWRAAVFSEVSILFDNAFIGYFDNAGTAFNQVGRSFNGGGYVSYANQDTDIAVFHDLFGTTFERLDPITGVYTRESLGLFYGGISGIHYATAVLNYDPLGETTSHIFTPDRIHSDIGIDGVDFAGLFLVRETTVPEASSVLLLVFGLLGLFISTKRKV